ncbi:MAG: hypothetical protein KQI78_09595 [Deltaproteobacteria bacterium]|nr:hypothetical protein [Deltaproteobacteria bacterium]
MKTTDKGIDPFSFQLGMINCFAEMVACGVKQLAISPPLSTAEYEALAPYSDQIVKGFGIASYLEKSLMVTLLQSPEFTQNKCSILYYKTETTLAAYLELKERQTRLIASDGYDADAQKALSVAFMNLLSYPSDVIESKLSGVHLDPFILIDDAE